MKDFSAQAVWLDAQLCIVAFKGIQLQILVLRALKNMVKSINYVSALFWIPSSYTKKAFIWPLGRLLLHLMFYIKCNVWLNQPC